MSNAELAYYLYCLTPAGGEVQCSAIGVDGQRRVTVRACGEIAAVFSEVEVDEFRGESAEACLQDLAWLGPRVCRHEAVVEEVMRQAPVLPARFATLFASVDSLQQKVVERREAIAQFFVTLGARQEWAVKGLLHRTHAPAAEARASAASPGARYFEQKRIQAQRERDFNVRLNDFCRSAAESLAAEACGFRERKIVAPIDADVVFNWAFLLAPEALEEFRAQLDRLNGGEGFPGMVLAPTGPWPPYTFAPDLSGGAIRRGRDCLDSNL